MRAVAGARRSPNIWEHPDTYEIENRAVDRAGRIEAAIRAHRDWRSGRVLDIGCGTGFHLPRFAIDAAAVVGVEPHLELAERARRRCRDLPNVDVGLGVASRLPVADASIDVAHARWAYFFGPGCEPGLDELDRVMRTGGSAFVIDNDTSSSTFGRWFRSAYPSVSAEVVERFFSTRGWTRTPLRIDWAFDSRADFEAVVAIEFPTPVVGRILADHVGCRVDYAINLWHKDF